MSVTIGWWALPLMVTLGCFGFVAISSGRDLSLGGAIASAIGGLVALIVSLIAWLIWAVAT